MVDLSHIPLLGESPAQALQPVREHIAHIHIGNAYFKDRKDPAWGDQHPRFGYPGSANDVPEIVDFLREVFCDRLPAGRRLAARRRVFRNQTRGRRGSHRHDCRRQTQTARGLGKAHSFITMKITVLDGYTLNPGDNPWDKVSKLGTFVCHDRTPGELIVDRAKDADIILTNKTPLSADTLPSCRS